LSSNIPSLGVAGGSGVSVGIAAAVCFADKIVATARLVVSGGGDAVSMGYPSGGEVEEGKVLSLNVAVTGETVLSVGNVPGTHEVRTDSLTDFTKPPAPTMTKRFKGDKRAIKAGNKRILVETQRFSQRRPN
jgi:hypothetical protein